MRVKILKVSGPFPTVMKGGEPPVDVWAVRFIYGGADEQGGWQCEDLVNITGELTITKVKDAVKALLEAEKPHPMDGTEFEV